MQRQLILANVALLALTALVTPAVDAAASPFVEVSLERGDLDGNGIYDFDDVAILRSVIMGAPTKLSKGQLDIDQNGTLDQWDVEMLTNWAERSAGQPEPEITPVPEPKVIPGDVDGNGVVDENDAVQMQEIVMGIAKPKNGWASADFNGDGRITLQDLIDLVELLWGPEPN